MAKTDLPEPDSPTNANVSPYLIVKLISSTALITPVSESNYTLKMFASNKYFISILKIC